MYYAVLPAAAFGAAPALPPQHLHAGAIAGKSPAARFEPCFLPCFTAVCRSADWGIAVNGASISERIGFPITVNQPISKEISCVRANGRRPRPLRAAEALDWCKFSAMRDCPANPV